MHALSILFALVLSNLASDAPWPGWRGPHADGVSAETSWTAHGARDDLWRRNVGLGYSCAVVGEGRVFTVGFDAEREVDVLWCLDATTGEVLWQDEYASELFDHNHGGGTLATPCLDGDRLFVANRLGGLRCYEAESGELLWFQNLAKLEDVDPGYYGFAISPIVRGDVLFVAMGKLMAFDKLRGGLLWSSEFVDARYSTPTPFELRGESLFALFTHDGLEVLSATDGSRRYFHPWQKGERRVNASSPVVVGDRIFISSAYEHGCALLEFGESETPTVVWANRSMRNKMAGCVLVDGFLYGFDESMLKCLDLEGNERWRVRGLGNGAISGAPGRLLVTTSRGELIVAEANPEEFRELSRTKLVSEGVFWSAPVLAGGLIYFRGSQGELVCRDHRPESESKPVAQDLGAIDLVPAITLVDRHAEATGGAERWRALESLSLFGTFATHSVGIVPGAMRIDFAAPNLWRLTHDLPPPIQGQITRVFDGQVGYELNPYRGNSLFSPEENAALAETRRLHGPVDLLRDYTELETIGLVLFNDRMCWRVAATSPAGLQRGFYFDRESGRLAGHAGENEEVMHFEAYRDFDGLSVPTRIIRYVPETGIEETILVERIELDAVTADAFTRPQEIQELLDSGGDEGG